MATLGNMYCMYGMVTCKIHAGEQSINLDCKLILRKLDCKKLIFSYFLCKGPCNSDVLLYNCHERDRNSCKMNEQNQTKPKPAL